MLSAYVVHKAMHRHYSHGTVYVQFRLFGLPPLDVELRSVNETADFEDGAEVWMQGYVENMKSLKTRIDIERAALMVKDGHEYLAAKHAAIGNLSRMWCQAELAIGRDA